MGARLLGRQPRPSRLPRLAPVPGRLPEPMPPGRPPARRAPAC